MLSMILYTVAHLVRGIRLLSVPVLHNFYAYMGTLLHDLTEERLKGIVWKSL